MRRYQHVVQLIEAQIDGGLLRPRDRVPSVREMSEQTGYSAVTVHHAYVELESRGLLVARPRSGFFVADSIRKLAEFPIDGSDLGRPDVNEQPQSPLTAFFRMAQDWKRAGVQHFGSMHASEDMAGRGELEGRYIKALRSEGGRSHALAHDEGEMQLKEALAKRAGLRGMLVRPKNVTVTRSARAALNLSLQALTRPGDTVLVESPSYPPLLDALERRGNPAVEIYSHPTYGIDPDQFDYLLDHNDIKACAIMTAHHFPTGVTYPEATLRRILAKATERRVPIIENDVFGELAQVGGPRTTLFHLDESGIVTQFGSFEEIAGPRFGLGWVLHRGGDTRVAELHFLGDPPAGSGAMQSVIADFMLKRSYERYLRQLREELGLRMRTGLAFISRHFPQECAVSKPDGGFMCWVRGPRGFDSISSARRARDLGVSYAPGPIFSVTNSFRNFFALNLSCNWGAFEVRKLQQFAEMLAPDGRGLVGKEPPGPIRKR